MDKRYVAVNKRPECDEKDCYLCDYFGPNNTCFADDKLIGCKYCRNANSDARLDEDHDLSYCSIGECDNGFGTFIAAHASSRVPSVVIMVQQWNEQHQCNHIVSRFVPKYCPMCGRLITENEPYLHRDDGKDKNNV